MVIISLAVLLAGCAPVLQPDQSDSDPMRPIPENSPATNPPNPAPTDQPIETSVPPTAAPEAAVLTATDVQRITPEDAFELANAGSAVLLDTRSLERFIQLRIAGALPFPEVSAAEYLATLPSGMMLIFY
jgi:hypothetical protein